MTPDNSPQQGSTSPLDDLVNDGETSPNDDLGRRMGRDARRVSRGELSEGEFYDKYHDEVVEQFGFDRRPGGETE